LASRPHVSYFIFDPEGENAMLRIVSPIENMCVSAVSRILADLKRGLLWGSTALINEYAKNHEHFI
jgi:hypothetical protein